MARQVGPFTLIQRPPRTNDPREWTRWYQNIYAILSGNPGIAWDVVDKTGSRLDEIETRDHNLLQSVEQADENSTSTVLEKHITDLLAYEWERNRRRISSETVDFTASTGTFHSCDCTSGSITVILPSAASNTGYPIWLHKSDSTLNKVLTSVRDILFQNSTMLLVSDGTNWVVS